MFGKKKQDEQTVLLLDIENASVGAALAHLSSGTAPVLFAEQRAMLTLPRTVRSDTIAQQIEKAAHETLLTLSLVAARLRASENTAHRGELAKAAVFLGAPWGVPNLVLGKPEFSSSMQKFLTSEIHTIAHDLPVSFYTSADAAGYGSTLLNTGGVMLVAILRGEIIELVLLGEKGALGYATVPIGSRSVYRTLQTHAGLSLAEIPALLTLANQSTYAYHEPLEVAGRHLLEFVAPGVEALARGGVPQHLVVVADEPLGSWFARTLESDPSLGALFAPDATIRTLGNTYIAKHLAGRVAVPDLHLSLGALFTHGKLKGFNSV